ncbi:MAG TPA: TolC family protein [Vicinamibacterales bacterium]|nr:TolC family protein [Vicinamibacterales bacterium]
MKKSFTPTRTFVASLALAALVAAPARAQEVSDEKVRSLLAQAQAQTQTQAAPGAPQDAASAQGRAVVNLTMDEAVAKALDNNLDLSVAKLTPQLQDLSLQQTRAAYTPTLANTTFGLRSNTNRSTNTLFGGALVDTQVATYNMGVGQVLPWTGGTLGLNFTNSRQETNNRNQTINPLFSTGFQLNLSQPLLRNFRIDSTRQAIQTGIINRRLADVTLRGTTVSTVASTANAYWDLVYANQAVEAAKRSLALAEKLVQDNQSRVEIGTMAPIDVVQAQSEVATRQLALVQAEATLRTTELSLKRLLVDSTSDPLWTAAINPTDRPPAQMGEPIDLEAALKRALGERTDIVQAREQLAINDISIRYLKNQKLPDITLNAQYGASGTGGTLIERSSPINGEITNRIPGGYSDALSLLRRLTLPSWNVNVSISYPLGTSAQDVSHARAQVQLRQTQAQLRSLELRVATEITNAGLTVQSNLQQVQAAAASRELALRRLEAEQSKFEVGMSTNYNVVLAQRDFADAQNAELRALLNYRKSLVEFERLQQTGGSSGVTSVGGGSSSGATGASTGSTGNTGGGSDR